LKYIKLAILSFIVLFIIVMIISLFMPSHVQISRARNMDTETGSLWRIIDDFKTWGQWNTLVPDLAEQNPDYSEEQLKTQEVTIKWKEKQTALHVATIERSKSKPIITGWKVAKDAATDSLMVQWYIDIQLRWHPWEKFAGMLYEKSYGEKLSDGLDRLKNLVENRSPAY
jgi:hypothetical protein